MSDRAASPYSNANSARKGYREGKTGSLSGAALEIVNPTASKDKQRGLLDFNQLNLDGESGQNSNRPMTSAAPDQRPDTAA